MDLLFVCFAREWVSICDCWCQRGKPKNRNEIGDEQMQLSSCWRIREQNGWKNLLKVNKAPRKMYERVRSYLIMTLLQWCMGSHLDVDGGTMVVRTRRWWKHHNDGCKRGKGKARKIWSGIDTSLLIFRSNMMTRIQKFRKLSLAKNWRRFWFNRCCSNVFKSFISSCPDSQVLVSKILW